ncbi:MAG: type II toxin-antitoxin system Phd/YefM family antitoxin [Rhodoglobus sp.]
MPEPTIVSLYEAKTHLSELGERASRGEQIIVTKHGKPRFVLMPVPTQGVRPLPGTVPLASLTKVERESVESVDWSAPDADLEVEFGMRE